jgi:hypothetical protein
VSQPIGLNFKTRIPTFADDASIQEAFSVYHYGVDNYTTQAIPDDSIEGHFRSIDSRLDAAETNIAGLGSTFIEQISTTSDPNLIRPQSDNIIPLTIRGFSASQNADLQRWAKSDGTELAKIFPSGAASFANYVAVGNVAQTTTTALKVNIGASSHKGIVIDGVVGQSDNLQEWTKTDGVTTSVVTRVDKDGKIFSNNGQTGTTVAEVVTISGTQTLTNKTLTNASISGGTVDVTNLRKLGVDVVTLTGLETLTNKTLTSPTINTPTITNGTINATILQRGGVDAVTTTDTQTITNKTLTSPTINTATISTPSITGGTISNATSITVTGAQTLNSFRVRNVYLSTAAPTNAQGSDGDIWIRYN